MENFVLYENLGKRDHVTIYKGRRKGTINFVAIHCIDKCKRPEVTNTVRMTHDVSHVNIVQFYEWYETSNHLWLVVELCTGGTLSSLIKQDGSLPESAVRTFGIDLVTGLHYIHSLGIIFNDLQPAKVLLDTTGALKYGDFGLSKGEGENLKELFHGFADAGEQWNPENMEEVYNNIVTTGNPSYTAPEVLQGREPSVLSDLWSLGCVFYELFTGHPPFLAESEDQLKEKIITQDYPPPKVRGTRFSSKPSPDYLNIVESLLQKDPTRRLGWAGLVNHPFWQNTLSKLAKDLTMSQDVQASAMFTGRSSVFEHGGGSVLGKIKGLDLPTDRPTSRLDTTDSARPSSTMGEYLRPKTAPGSDGGSSLFMLSARPHTAAQHDERVASPFRTLQSPLSTQEPIRRGVAEDATDGTTNEILQNIYHPSDFTVSSIVDNPKIQKPSATKYDPKTLPVPPYAVDKLVTLSDKDFVKHIKILVENIGNGEKGLPSQKRIHLLHYAASIAGNSKIAQQLLQQNALQVLGRQVKETQHVEVRIKMARVMGLIALNSDELSENINVSEPITTLTEVIRENLKNAKVKLGLLPAVGEMLYLVASQEQGKGESYENWLVPSMTYTVIARSCRDGEDALVHHVAAKIVENICSVKGPHALKFVSTEMGQALWYLFKHSTPDSVRCTAMSALCRVIWHNQQIFQSVIDIVGLTTVLSSLSLGISSVQQAVITMFGALIGSGVNLNRLFQDKDFLQKIMRLFESPSTLIRAKAFMVVHELTKASSDILLSACNARLVMYIERDSRRQTPREPRSESPDAVQFLNQALDKLINHITQAVPNIIKEILSVLDSVSGRKHPSANQTRQLKSTLPLLPIGLHLVTSQVFRNRVVNEEFIKDLGLLLSCVNSVENKETKIEASSSSLGGATEFTNTVMSILEGISQHPSLIIQYHQVVMETILPSLATLVKSQNVDTKVLSLRLLSEIASVYLSQDQYGPSENKVDTQRLHQIITENLLTQFEPILLDMDPLPSYALKLILSLLEQNVSFIKQFSEQGLIPVIFQVLQDHQNNPASTTMQSIMSIINCLITHRQTNLQELYDQGLIDSLTTLFFEVSTVCLDGEDNGQDIKSANTMLQILLETLNNILKYVSDIVRKALQAKKSGSTSAGTEAEWAEQLLMYNKPLTDLTSDLTHLLCYDDSDIYDVTVKSLSLLVQLYGGEHKEAMSGENMEYYSVALKKADVKKQKILLRVIKRLVGTDTKHAERMKLHGELLANTIKSLVQTASSHADVGMTTLAAEILKITGHLKD